MLSVPKNYLARLAAFEIWDTHCYDRYIPLKKGMTVVDAGASVGFFSVYASKKVGDTGRVIAFEPEPVSYSHLAKNVSDSPNIIAKNVGLSNENKTAKMFYQSNIIYGDMGTQYSLYSAPANKTDKTVDVTLRRLDSVLPSLGVSHVDFLKIDTEGAEYPILQGLGEMLWNVDNIAMETHAKYQKGVETDEQLKQLLESYGFRTKKTSHYGLMPYMYATRDYAVQFPFIETWQILTIGGLAAGLLLYRQGKK